MARDRRFSGHGGSSPRRFRGRGPRLRAHRRYVARRAYDRAALRYRSSRSRPDVQIRKRRLVALRCRRPRCPGRLLAKGRVRCKLGSENDDGRRSGTCHTGEKDIAAELVNGGHVFATSGLFTTYGSLESAARANKVGVWGGEAARPDDYRAQKWEEAKRDAPDGCPIKGNLKGGRRIYTLPWAQDYERVRMSGKGDRWFCSKSEARQAGWKPSEQS